MRHSHCQRRAPTGAAQCTPNGTCSLTSQPAPTSGSQFGPGLNILVKVAAGAWCVAVFKAGELHAACTYKSQCGPEQQEKWRDELKLCTMQLIAIQENLNKDVVELKVDVKEAGSGQG